MTSVADRATQPDPATGADPGAVPATGDAPVGAVPSVGAVPPAGAMAADPAYPPPPYYVEPEPDRLTRFATRLWTRSPRWLAPVAALGCMAGAVGYTVLADPAAADAEAVPTCLLKYTTGFDCPGCGGTRAFWYLLHGDLPAAARHHVLFVFAVPFLLYIYLAWAGQRLFRWRLPQLTLSPRTIGVFLAVWAAFRMRTFRRKYGRTSAARVIAGCWSRNPDSG